MTAATIARGTAWTAAAGVALILSPVVAQWAAVLAMMGREGRGPLRAVFQLMGRDSTDGL